MIPARDPKQCAGAKGYETSGDDDDDDDGGGGGGGGYDDTQSRAQSNRHMRAHES